MLVWFIRLVGPMRKGPQLLMFYSWGNWGPERQRVAEWQVCTPHSPLFPNCEEWCISESKALGGHIPLSASVENHVSCIEPGVHGDRMRQALPCAPAPSTRDWAPSFTLKRHRKYSAFVGGKTKWRVLRVRQLWHWWQCPEAWTVGTKIRKRSWKLCGRYKGEKPRVCNGEGHVYVCSRLRFHFDIRYSE